MDIQQKAQELADALATSKEYKRLKDAREAVDAHQAAKVMLRDFHKKQSTLQQQQMEGKPITESQGEELRKLYEVLSINPYIRELFEAEFVFSGIMMEIQEVIGKSLGLTPEEDPAAELDSDQDTPSDENVTKTPPKKLWTPGN